jgi:polyisoprenoid-binding protein YceI
VRRTSRYRSRRDAELERAGVTAKIAARMRRTTTALTCLALLLLANPALGADGVWKIDPAHSSAEFAIKHFALSSVKGTIPVTEGSLVLPAGKDIPTAVTATLDVTAIDTKNDDRNKDLRSGDWFDVATYPTGMFKSTQISGSDPTKFTIAGNLTLHGVTKLVTLQAQLEGRGIGGRGEKRVAYSATTMIHRRDFGLANVATNATGALVVGEDADISRDIFGSLYASDAPLSGKRWLRRG